MFEILILLFPLILYYYDSLLKVYYFIKLINDFLLIRLWYKFTGNINNTLVNYLYNDIVNNGCFAIKFVQWIISRCKMMYPSNNYPEWLTIFNDFYEKCPTHSFEYTKKVIEKNFGESLENIFDYIDVEPIASGSIAQIHRCKYKKNNKECVIKIVHPNIRDKSSVSYKILCFLNYIMKSWIGRKFYYIFPPLDLKYFLKSLEDQTNLNIEAENMKNIAKSYSKDKHFIVVPECYYHSDNLIVMSYEEGEYFDEIDEKDYAKYKIVLCLSLLLRSMAVIYGSVHGDLHCANWKVRKIPNSNNDYQIVLYDYGIVIYPNKDFISNFLVAWEKCDFNSLIIALESFIEYHPFTEEEFERKKIELRNSLLEWTIKPLHINIILNLLCRWAAENSVIYNGNFLNFAVIMSLVEDDFRRFGLTGHDKKKEDHNETVECIFKVEYLNYINFCETKNVFSELKEYYETILKSQDIKFEDLFHKLEYKLSTEGINVEKHLEKKHNVEKKNVVMSLDL